MRLKDEFKKMVDTLATRFRMPPVADVFFPPFQSGGQLKDCAFMAVCLDGGAAGISYLLVPDDRRDRYTALKPADFIGKDPSDIAGRFGDKDPVSAMVGLAAVNAVCQHAMREIDFRLDAATDSLGLLSVSAEDKIGMVGLFRPLIPAIAETGAELVVIEKNAALIEKFPHLPVTLDPSELAGCNKILCTGTTLLNNSLDEILACCSPEAFISIIGPTAGYFPDPLFNRGVDVVGGRLVKDGPRLLQLLAERKPWADATRKICFQKKTYTGMF